MSITSSGASDLELTELRKKNLKRTLQRVHDNASSILLLTTQWKEVEQHFENTHSSIQQRSKELLAIQETVKESLEQVKEREEKLGSVQESIEERFREVEAKEKEFELSQKVAVEEQYKRIEWIQESSKELELVQESVGKKLKELEMKEEEYVSIKRSIDERFKELKLREEIFDKLKEKRFEQWSKDFELKEKQFVQELKDKEEKYEECRKEFELKEKQFELRYEEVELKGKKYGELSKEVELKDKRFKELFKKLELKEKQLEERSKEVDMKDKKLEERCKELGLKEKQVEERSKEVELKEKRYANTLHTQVKTEPEEENILVNNSSTSIGANLRFCVDMDGKSLQIFLNERWKEHDSMRNEVLVVLRLSSDPAQLVLDAMQGFYPPHLKKEDVEFEESVIRRTCILLLEQLMKLSPEIKPDVKKEATKLAFDWITKMRVYVGHSVEVLGFLQLLAAYGLANAFDIDELLVYLEIVAQHSQAPELLRVLVGFADKISGFIQNLIVKEQQVDAVKFIYAFKLVTQFPPVPLLKNYLKRSRKRANKFYKKGRKSFKGSNKARNKRVADLKAVIRCIEDHKLESECPTGSLKELVASLENQNANSQQNTPAFGPKTQSKRQRGRKRPWTAELAEASPKVFDSATSNVPSVQMPCLQPKGQNFNQDFIQNLIKFERRLEAIKYIYAWNMVDKFPPVQLLNDHLTYSTKNAEGLCKNNNNSISAQIGAIRKVISALRDVIKCIEDYKIEYEFSPKILEERIVELEKKKAKKQAKLFQQQKEKKSNAPTSAASSSHAIPASNKVITPLPTAAPPPATVPETKPQQEIGNKRPRIAISENQPPHQHPALHTIQGVPYMNAPARHYNLAGYPPMNLNTSSYHNNYIPYYPWDAHRRPGYY